MARDTGGTAVVTVSLPVGTESIRAQVLDAGARRQPLRIVGAGTWLDANRPVSATAQVTTRELTGVVEYVPGDLTITVRAGTTLAEIARVTAANDQWLTLDPHGSDEGTIGATIATASAGPLAHHFGPPRDVVLGLEFVTGTGAVVRGGGRVVKNVAGFDLTRLLTGSWGTLGVITEVTLRLRARPEADRTVAIRLPDGADDVRELRRRMGHLAAIPFAAELLDATLAHTLGIHDEGVLLVRFGGNETAARAQHAALASLGDLAEQPVTVWAALRAVEPRAAAVVRLSQLPSRLAETWHAAAQLADAWPGTLVHATMGRGIVRCILPAAEPDALRHALSLPFHGTRVFERLPAPAWSALAPSSIADRLSRGIRAAFDPHALLNPGILGDVPS